MARAVPSALGPVPGDHAAHVRADGRADGRGAGLIAVHSHFLAVALDDRALSALDRAQRLAVGPGEPVANHVVGIVRVLLDVVPQAPAECRPVGRKQLRPRVLAPQNRIGHHHPGQGTEGQAVPGETGGDELMVGCAADVRQAVGRLDDLARPPVRDLHARNPGAQRLLQARVAGLRVRGLTGLVILATEDDEVIGAMRVQPDVVIRVVRIPEQGVGDRALRHATRNHVTGIQGQLRLEQRGSGHVRQAD